MKRKSSDTTVPDGWVQLLNKEMLSRCISRISYEIVERDRDLSKLAVVGIRTGGDLLARRIQKRIEGIENVSIPLGSLDITLYRDDRSGTQNFPTLHATDLPFKVSGSRIILVDDVLYTGRTIRAALDAIADFGRPSRVELVVLVDRAHSELPIRPDYWGRRVSSGEGSSIRVRLTEMGHEDGVYLMPLSPSEVFRGIT